MFLLVFPFGNDGVALVDWSAGLWTLLDARWRHGVLCLIVRVSYGVSELRRLLL